MSKKLITEQYLTDIADAINTKSKANKQYTPQEMAAAITAIPTGGSDPSKFGFGSSYSLVRSDDNTKFGFGSSYSLSMPHTGIYYGYGTTQTGSTSAGTLA